MLLGSSTACRHSRQTGVKHPPLGFGGSEPCLPPPYERGYFPCAHGNPMMAIVVVLKMPAFWLVARFSHRNSLAERRWVSLCWPGSAYKATRKMALCRESNSRCKITVQFLISNLEQCMPTRLDSSVLSIRQDHRESSSTGRWLLFDRPNTNSLSVGHVKPSTERVHPDNYFSSPRTISNLAKHKNFDRGELKHRSGHRCAA